MKIKVLPITRRVGLIDLFKEKGFKIGVEIGTDRGGYAKDICERFPQIKLYTIDPWLPYNEGDEVKDRKAMQEIEAEARETLSQYPNCRIIHDSSMQAINNFQDESIDFVFIDGDHTYYAVLDDIAEWTKKVKKGGIVAGHDYVKDDFRQYGVIEAVNGYCEKSDIDLFIGKKGTFVPFWFFYKK